MGTTTATVGEFDREQMIGAGWTADDLTWLASLAEPFAVGTVVERRLDSVTAR